MGILVHAVSGGRCLLQYVCRSRIQSFFILFPGNELVFIHTPEHVIRPVVGNRRVIPILALAGIQVPPRIVVIGVIGRTGQHGAFPDAQVTQVFAEISLGSDLDAVIVFAQEDRVQVALQDLVLCIAVLQLQGKVSLLDFPLIALFRRKQGVFDQLLCNGGTALCGGRGQVEYQRTHNPLQVHTVVGIEAGVLHRDKGIAKHFWHGRQRHQYPVFGSFVFCNQIIIAIIDKRSLCLRIQRHQVQLRRRIHIALGDTRQSAQSGHTGKHNNHNQYPDRVQQHTDDKIRFPGLRAENAAGFRFLLRVILIIVIILRPGSFLFIRFLTVDFFPVIVRFLVLLIAGFFGIIRFVIPVLITVLRKTGIISFIGRITFEFFEVVFFPFLLTEHSYPPVCPFVPVRKA